MHVLSICCALTFSQQQQKRAGLKCSLKANWGAHHTQTYVLMMSC